MKTTIMAIFAAALIIFAGCAQTEKETINVAGSSELTFDPDEAEVWAGISVLKTNAADAQSEANRVINAVIDGLRYKGISDSDISTEQLNLYEEKEWSGGEYKSVGWRATQTLKIKTKDMSKVGTIVDVAVNNGANQINSIQFGLSPEKEQEYKQKALADAAKNAKEKAETIATSLGVKLGKVKTVSESNYYYRPYVYAMEKTAAVDMVQEAAAVMPGDVAVNGQISIVYYIG